ncbi:hypothetical protein BDQ17DRAFT_1356079 [Cyathus striatus]|nr:hypothetical protein BDQ17DRAFT_1356079 [Cyathus striatus]
MFFYIPVAIALASSLLLDVSAAPTASLDANTLLSNAQQAQKANAQFAALKATDPCTNGEEACLSNSIAQCVNGTWDTTQDRCLKSQSCFALPNVNQEGIILSCTSERKALSVISASGATGGITGSDDSSDSSSSSSQIDEHTSMMNAASSTKVDASPSATVDASASDYTPLPTVVDLPGADSSGSQDQFTSATPISIVSSASGSSSAASSTITPAPSSTSDSNQAVDVVTVTITLGPGTTTLAPQTTLLSPSDAAKAISSLLQQEGATLISGSIVDTATASASEAVEAAATSTGLSPGGYRYAY